MGQFHVIVDNAAGVESSSSYDSALVAIASVAAVLWTGGLIIRQLFPSYVTMIVQNGMYFTMFAAFASLGGLIADGLVLQVLVGCFFVIYVKVAILDIQRYRRKKKLNEPLPIGLKDVAAVFQVLQNRQLVSDPVACILRSTYRAPDDRVRSMDDFLCLVLRVSDDTRSLLASTTTG